MPIVELLVSNTICEDGRDTMFDQTCTYILSSTACEHVDGIFTSTYWELKSRQRGEDTVIAILDSGINKEHAAFQWPSWYRKCEPKVLPAPKYSKNFRPDQLQNDITDHTGHGTFCAGVAAGSAYNNACLPKLDQQYALLQEDFPGGVASGAYLIVCRTDCSEGEIGRALDHLMEIQTRKVDPIKVHVASMSFGFEKHDPDIERKVNDLTFKYGTICVASAGNTGEKGSRPITYPAKYSNVVCSGANDRHGHQTDFSSTGERMAYLAPGKDVIGPVTHTPECLNKRHCTCNELPDHALKCAALRCTCLTENHQAVKCDDGTSFSAAAIAGLISNLIQLAKSKYDIKHLHFHVISSLLKRLSSDPNEKDNRKLQPKDYLEELQENPGIFSTLTRQLTGELFQKKSPASPLPPPLQPPLSAQSAPSSQPSAHTTPTSYGCFV